MATTILTANKLSQRFVTDLIFDDVTLQINEREHIALVGSNGAGKSTLLKILAGSQEPTSGSVVVQAGLRVAYQAQEARFDRERSLYDEALDAFEAVRETGRKMSAIEQEMAEADGDRLESLLEQYSRLSTEFEAHHGYEMEHLTAQVLSGLGFPEDMFGQPVNRLSGGQKTRVALAKALLSDPDLLMLDEPTNHLDLQAIEWLEGFLKSWNRAFIVVSHDRYFLDKVTTRTLDMAFGRLEDYPGGYTRYLKLREERYARRVKEYEEQQEFIARTEEFIRKYKAGQRSREAKGRETRLARLERIDRPQVQDNLNLGIRATQRSGRMAMTAKKLAIGYPSSDGSDPDVLVRREDELAIERGDRVALLGPNGSGKTTALRSFVGDQPLLSGRIDWGTNVRVAYYAQGHEGLDPSRTVLNTILHDQPMGEEAARTLLGRFLFSADDVFKQVSALSGGERSRLALARLTLERANFLVLDEPTNHLDIQARETLEQALDQYDGTILFVSHDRYFIDRIANRIWAIEDRTMQTYLGNYTDMLRERERRQPNAAEAPVQTKPSSPAPASNGARRDQRQLDRALKEVQKRLTATERRISKLEERLNNLSDDLSRASIDQDVEKVAEIGSEYESVQEELEHVYDEWSAIGAEHETLMTEAAAYAEGT
ncbi:MAG TPA: ABC-F family ATP-binding cassette domain-containing protein [Thermomicrobiales bacterium]|nr:ABC-F family ATP-binding cassette domain-containing protein [Thermomicrobiales bacterium]